MNTINILEHKEAIITTVIGILSSIYFYYRAKTDGIKSSIIYKEQLIAANGELQRLRKQLEIKEVEDKKHYQQTGHVFSAIIGIEQKFDSFGGTSNSTDEIALHLEKLIKEKKFAEAKNYLAGKTTILDNLPFILFWQGNIERCMGTIKEAVSIYESITQTYSVDQCQGMNHIHMLLGLIHKNHYSDISKALIEYQKAYAIEPNIYSITALAICYNSLRQFNLAKSKIDEGKLIDPNHLDLLCASATYYYENGFLSYAYQEIKSAEISHGFNSGITILEAQILRYENKYAEAAECCKKVIKFDPTHAQALYELTAIYLTENKILQAEHTAKILEENYPNDLFYIDLFMTIEYINGDTKKIIERAKNLNFNHLAKINPTALHIVGLSFLIMGETEKAKTCFSLILSIYDNHRGALDSMFYVYLADIKIRNLDEAKQYCNFLFEKTDEPKVAYLIKQGLIEVFRKNFCKAIYFFEEALILSPHDQDIITNITRAKELETIFHNKSNSEFEEHLDEIIFWKKRVETANLKSNKKSLT